jgi:hypothetical protein
MTTILIIIIAMLGSGFLVYFKEGAELTFSLNKGFLLGIVTSQSYYLDEGETDYSYQVCLGILIMTLTWTKEDTDEQE